MKAVGYQASPSSQQPPVLQDLDLPTPTLRPHDLLVHVRAVSVNPVDTKVRMGVTPEPGATKVLGWDAVGTVQALGSQAQGFAVGDRVYYAGSIDRPGTNSELHAVDARIAAKAPTTASDAQAAALPLTSITAWEILFDRLKVARGDASRGQTLLVVGGAGGVGSMLIQLARQLTGLTVVATASRPETRQWCLDLGAHHVIDHRQPMAAQLSGLGLEQIDMVASLTHTTAYFAQYVEMLKAQGQIALIDDMASLDVVPLKRKSLSLHWELMFTRPLYGTPDLARQGELLAEVAALIDAGRLRSTLTTTLDGINARNLQQAHELVESGKTIGKVVLEGF
ncbi:MAG: zinc-binding alcohol dehydrogenase family protein [Comamonadaceae bacterium]|nr:MAG: zinc-binding alcohol dehydrogenase family protein [Comamonadaceae bacterium]